MSLQLKRRYRAHIDDLVRGRTRVELLEEADKVERMYILALETLDPSMSTEDFKQFVETEEKYMRQIQQIMMVLFFRGMQLGVERDLAEGQRLWKIMQSIQAPLHNWLKGDTMGETLGLDEQNATRLFTSLDGTLYTGVKKSSLFPMFPTSNDTRRHYQMLRGGDIKYDVRPGEDQERTASVVAKATKIRNKAFDEYQNSITSAGKTGTFADLERDFCNPDGAVRLRAINEITRHLSSKGDALILALECRAQAWIDEAWGYFARGEVEEVDLPLTLRSLHSGVSVDLLKGVLEVTKHPDYMHRYFAEKARQAQKKKLAYSDVRAPVSTRGNHLVPLDKGLEEMLASFERISPQFREYAEEILHKRRFDSHPRKAKTQGNFNFLMSPGGDSLVLTNYTGNLFDRFLLTLEFAKAVHMKYARHLPLSNSLPGGILKNVAGIFAQVVYLDHIERSASPEEKKGLLAYKIELFGGTNIVRQAEITRTELEIYNAVRTGTMSRSVVEGAWCRNLKRQYGPSVMIHREYGTHWPRALQLFDNPLGCVEYTLGTIIALALRHQHINAPTEFVPMYEGLLSLGSTKPTVAALQDVGVDITDPQILCGANNIIKDWVEQYVGPK
jgi:oligoendopeptidase F